MKGLRITFVVSFVLFVLSCSYGVMAQTAPTFYQCPDVAREGQTAHLGSECPSWVWSAPNSNFLIASCGAASCSWNSNVRWRRVADVTGTSAISACTGTVSGKSCSREAWVAKGTYFAPPPPPPVPVDCVVGAWSDWTIGEWGQCRDRLQTRTETRSRTVITPASNGGTACPALTETRSVTQACSLSPPCWPHGGDVYLLRVRFDKLVTPHPKYNMKATWFCATPTGPKQSTWAFGWPAIADRAVWEQKLGTYNEQEAEDECEGSCEIVTGALKDELDAFAAQFTVEQIGVIE